MDAPQWNGDVQDWPSVEDAPDIVDPQSYCDRQACAKLAQCARCGRWVYFVNHARVCCMACREEAR